MSDDRPDTELVASAHATLDKLNSVFELAANHATPEGERLHPTAAHLLDMTVTAGIADRDLATRLVRLLLTTGQLVAYDVGGLATFLCRPSEKPDPADIADEDGWITCQTSGSHDG